MTALAFHMNRSVLQASLSEGRFRLFFQAQYAVSDRSVAGFEGVVRWRHPELGLLPPGLFMAALEREGLGGALTCAVAAQAARAASDWSGQGRAVPVAINIGLAEARDASFAGRLEDVVRAAGARPEMLVLEAPESELARDPIEGFAVLERLRARGFAIVLDARGAGDVPLDGRARALFAGLKCGGPAMVQVARSLGAGHASPFARRLLAARAAGLVTTAVGVETPASIPIFEELGFERLQGNALHRPAPIEEADIAFDGPQAAAPVAALAAILTAPAPPVAAPEDLRPAVPQRLRLGRMGMGLVEEA